MLFQDRIPRHSFWLPEKLDEADNKSSKYLPEKLAEDFDM